MGNLSYYFATSLDGFIARENGDVDWLDAFQMQLNTPYDYDMYYSSVSALIFGRKTWEFVQNYEGKYPYPGKPVILFTRIDNYQPSIKIPQIEIHHEVLPSHISSLKQKYPNRIWLVGGGKLAASMIAYDLIDELVLTIIPNILGNGIPWISHTLGESQWKLKDNFSSSSGIMQLVYERLKKD